MGQIADRKSSLNMMNYENQTSFHREEEHVVTHLHEAKTADTPKSLNLSRKIVRLTQFARLIQVCVCFSAPCKIPPTPAFSIYRGHPTRNMEFFLYDQETKHPGNSSLVAKMSFPPPECLFTASLRRDIPIFILQFCNL
jgi:hypothetical protein